MGVWAIIKRIVLILIAWFFLYQVWVLVHICWWTQFNPTSTAFMEASLDRLQDEDPDATLQFQWVDDAKISNQLKRAVIASEDAKFMTHNGFDWEGIQHAWNKNIKKGKIVAGGSTISQQLAKNLFLSGSRNPLRKGEEAIITVMLEHLMTKDRILEIYLNVIEWGDGIFGAEAAARHYYKISAKNLSASQAAKLAAMIPNPRFYDQHRSTRFLNRHASTVKARMHMVDLP